MTDIKAIITETPFAVVGGIATRLYMPERMADDLGILVLTEDAENIDRELAEAGSMKVG